MGQDIIHTIDRDLGLAETGDSEVLIRHVVDIIARKVRQPGLLHPHPIRLALQPGSAGVILQETHVEFWILPAGLRSKARENVQVCVNDR